MNNIKRNGRKMSARMRNVSEPIRKLCLRDGILLLLGGSYAAVVRLTGWAVPCLFRKLTGFLCPGCGITRACVKLFRGDVAGAFSCNPFLFFIAPFLAYLILRSDFNYIKKNTRRLNRADEALTYLLVAATLIFGIARNIVSA